MKISLVVIAKNEAEKISACIGSAADLVEEVLVVDSGSTDGTQALAESMGARVLFRPFKGHIEQKNAAAQEAQNEWVLSLDADEQLDERARQEMQRLKAEGPRASAYGWNRLNHYGQQAIRHGAWYPDRKLRLWKKNAGSWQGQNPHDKWVPKTSEKVAWLKGHILHFSFNGPQEHRKQAERFAEIAAAAMHGQGRRSAWFRPYLHGGLRWVRDYLWLGGFLDGKAGWQIAGINAWEAFEKYRRLGEI
jgi:hypothetical protein